MLKLNLPTEDYWLELDKGVRVLVHPLSAIIMQIAQDRVIKLLKDSDPDEDVDERKARIHDLLAKELACAAIVNWEGVFTPDGSDPAPLNHAHIRELMSIWFIARAFFEKYTSSLDALYIEGNGSGSAVNGISTAGQNTAGDAMNKNSRARKLPKGKTSAPTSSTNP
jgi:hypothetical protein